MDVHDDTSAPLVTAITNPDECFVWAVSVLHFFSTLARNGGVYIINNVHTREIMMTFFPTEANVWKSLRKIFDDMISVDCSLYAQIIAQRSNTDRAVFGTGIYAHVILARSGFPRKILYVFPKDRKVGESISKSSCNSKGQWIIETAQGL